MGLRAAVATSMAGKTVEVVTLVLLATIVPRALGPEDFGRFSVALTLVTLGSLVLTLGGPTLMARVVPAAEPGTRVALARAIGLRLAKGRAVQVAVLAFAVLGVALFDPDVVTPLEASLVFAAFALNVATSLALQVALGLGRTVPWSLRYPLQNAVLVVGVLVLHPTAGLEGAYGAILASALAGAALAAVVVTRAAGGAHPKVAVPPGTIRFGALLAGGAALVQVTQRGGVVAVALWSGSSRQVGYCALAIGIALGVTYAVLQAFTVALPHVATRPHRDDGLHDGEAPLRRMAWLLLGGLLPLAAVAAATLPWSVPTMFGDDYARADAAFGPALALVVLAPLSALLTQTAALRVRPHVALVGGIAGAVAFLVVAVAAVPPWGAVGGTAAAYAGAVATVVVAVRALRGATSGRLATTSLLGSALVLALAAVAT